MESPRHIGFQGILIYVDGMDIFDDNISHLARDKKGWTSRVGLANRLSQKDKW